MEDYDYVYDLNNDYDYDYDYDYDNEYYYDDAEFYYGYDDYENTDYNYADEYDYDYSEDYYYEYSDYDQEVCDYSWECREFYQCDESLKNHDEEYCWIEECYNDCGEEYCNVFRTDESLYNEYDGTYYWATEECPAEPADEIAASAIRAARVAEAFDDTFMTAFEQFCPDGQCIGGSEESAPELNATEVSIFVNQTFADERNSETAQAAIRDAERIFDVDLSTANEVITTRNETVVTEIVKQGQEFI
jgi:hypothetical protein